MKSLENLARVIKIFGWFSIIAGALALLALITTAAVELTLRSISIVILALLGGVLYLVIASGLSKKKKWAWHLGIIVFSYSAIHNFILGALLNIIAGFVVLVFLVILLISRKAIFGQHQPGTNIVH